MRIALCLALAVAPLMAWLARDVLCDLGSWIVGLGGALLGLALHSACPLLEDNLRRRRRRDFLRHRRKRADHR